MDMRSARLHNFCDTPPQSTKPSQPNSDSLPISLLDMPSCARVKTSNWMSATTKWENPSCFLFKCRIIASSVLQQSHTQPLHITSCQVWFSVISNCRTMHLFNFHMKRSAGLQICSFRRGLARCCKFSAACKGTLEK